MLNMEEFVQRKLRIAELQRKAIQEGLTDSIEIESCECQIAIAADAVEETIKMREKIARISLAEPSVLNAIDFVMGFCLDFFIMYQDLIRWKGTVKENLYARNMIVLLYESANTMKSLFGKGYRDEMTTTIGDPSIETELKDGHKHLCKLSEYLNQEFSDLRNILAVHKHADPDVRKSVRDIDMVKVWLCVEWAKDVVIKIGPLQSRYMDCLFEKMQKAYPQS